MVTEADRGHGVEPHFVGVATWSELPDRVPAGAQVEGVDLVVIRRGDDHSVLSGRCLHRGALLTDGTVDGDNLLCGLHGWDYRIDTGVSAYNNAEALTKFSSVLVDDEVLDRHTASGTPAQMQAGFKRYEAVGLDEMVIAGVTEGAALRDVLAAVLPV